jgi:hypothetical protein
MVPGTSLAAFTLVHVLIGIVAIRRFQPLTD